MSTLVVLACALFVAYIAGSITFLKQIPPSISDTFYLFNEKKKGLGYIFTCWMLTEAYLMVYPILELSNGEWWQCIGFFCPALIAFCGCAPTFMDGGLTKKVHFFGAIGGVICGLVWCFLMNSDTSFVVTSIMVCISFFAGVATSTEDSCQTFWEEIAGFGTIAIVLLLLVI